MDELIQRLTSQLGIDASVAETATGKAMSMIKDNVGEDVFSQISGAIPGASEAAAGEPEPASGGGMLGKLAGMAAGKLGGNAGAGLELGASLSGAGLESGQVGGFVQQLVDFIREKAGDQVIDQVLAKFPMLKQLIG